MLPVPWVVKAKDRLVPNVESDDVFWTKFHDGSSRAHYERLCQVCGYATGPIMLLMATEPGGQLETSGPGLHPRCAALSLKFCPHLIEMAEKDEYVGFLYTGDGVGYIWDGFEEPFTTPSEVDPSAIPLKAEEIIKLAKLSPMGDKRRNHEEEDPKDQ